MIRACRRTYRRTRRPTPWLLASTLAVLIGCDGSPAPRGFVPRAMASAGDSITRAFDVGTCCVLSDSPQHSWATGDRASVRSHYLRLLSLNPRLAVYSYAKTGAKMADLRRQVRAAASRPVDYLVILMGANDVCTKSPSAMTPVNTFRSQFLRALTDFTSLRPRARIFVSSIPDVVHLWRVLHANPRARRVWNRFGFCGSVLGAERTDADRKSVAARERAFNRVLAVVCARFRQCRWDEGATFAFKFPPADVSTVDYFHPNEAGQRDLARITWAAGFFR